MAELIATGNTLTAWADVTVTAGTPVALYLKGGATDTPAPAGVNFEIAHKDPGGNYHVIDVLNTGNINAKGVIAGGGTFGLRRLASTYSAGMDSV